MDKKFIIILKPSGNRDLVFDHYVVHVQGSPPGQDRENYVEQDITYLPVSIVVTVPDQLQGYFSFKTIVKDKESG
jgi:hypothetical protein